MTKFDLILSKLPDAKKSGSNFSARCPAHDDRNASLSIKAGADGRVLLYCHAGCSPESVCAAIGLKLADLMPAKVNGSHHEQPRRIVAAYDYRDSDGELVYQSVRYQPKDFHQRRPDGKGGWTWNLEGITRILYRLPDLMNAREDRPGDWRFVGEGEKDVDNLWTAGLIATCNVGGAGKWKDEYSEDLTGERVCIIADKDKAGRAHAQQVAVSLQGKAADVRVVEVPGDGIKDASDYLLAGGTVEQLVAMADSAPTWTPDDVPAELEQDDEAPAFKFHTADEFDALDLRRDYHVPGILAAGPVPTILAGAFKTLKTSVVMALLLALATGSRFLGHFIARQCRVAVMSGESGGFALQNLARRIAHSMGWTLTAIGENFQICTGVPNLGSAEEMALIEAFIVEHEIKVLAIDPTYLAMRGLHADDAGNLFQVGMFLDALTRIGERTGCTMILVHHNSRGATRANPNEPAELADIAWSGFSEWAGQWILLSRRERYNPDSNGEHRLWLTAGGRDGHSTLVGVNVTEGRQNDPSGRRWEVEIEEAATARREAVEAEQDRKEKNRETRSQKQSQSDREAVVNAMSKLTDGDTKSAIRDRSKMNHGRFNAAFADLLADGTVQPCEIKKGNNRVYDGYKLHLDASGLTRTVLGQIASPDAEQ